MMLLMLDRDVQKSMEVGLEEQSRSGVDPGPLVELMYVLGTTSGVWVRGILDSIIDRHSIRLVAHL